MEEKTLYIEPRQLHDEMLRLKNEQKMDFLESLTDRHLARSRIS